MNQARHLFTSVCLLTLSAAFGGTQGCSTDEASKAPSADAGAAGEASGGSAMPAAGHGSTEGGAPAGGSTITGASGDTHTEVGGAPAGDAGAGATPPVGEAGAGGVGGAGGAGNTISAPVTVTIPVDGGDVPVTLASGQVVTFTFPASVAGQEVTLTPTDATSIGWPEGQFNDVITMTPDGLSFADPVVVRLGSKSLIVLDFSSSGTKGGGQGLALNAAGDGLLLNHFSTLAVVPSGKSCDSTSGWAGAVDDARCSAFGAATTYMEFGCKGYNFCQLIAAHCCALPGATDCQVGDANAAITYTDSDGNGTYAYCKPSFAQPLDPTNGLVGATVFAVGADWDSYFAQDPSTHFVSNVVFHNASGVPVYASGNPQTMFKQTADSRNNVAFVVPNIAPGTYDVSMAFRNGINSTTMPFTIN